MYQLFQILVQVPALDRLMDYLDAARQREIDAVTASLQALSLRLQQSNQGLEGALQKGK